MNPEKFTNKTNGITPRRWLRQCNPELSALISDKIGEGWITQLDELKKIDSLADDAGFRDTFMQIKKDNKKRLAEYILKKNNLSVNTDSIFDIQIKRIHEYKRQLLAAIHTIVLYNRIKANPDAGCQPRTVIFGGKAAPRLHHGKITYQADQQHW